MMIQYFYRLHSIIGYYVLYSVSLLFIYLMYSSLYLLIPYPSFVPPSLPLPFGNHKLIFFVCEIQTWI